MTERLDICSDLDGTLSSFAQISLDARIDPAMLTWLEVRGRELRHSGAITFSLLTGRSPEEVLHVIQGRIDLFDRIMTDFGMSMLTADDGVIDWNFGGDPQRAVELRKIAHDLFAEVGQRIGARSEPGLYSHQKRYGVVVHTRPCEDFLDAAAIAELEDDIERKLLELVDDVDGLGVKRGSRCVEIAPEPSKLDAFRAYRQEFAPRGIPAFFGDDLPDQPVLDHVAALGGLAVAVGDRLQRAHANVQVVPEPAGLVAVLETAVRNLGRDAPDRGTGRNR